MFQCHLNVTVNVSKVKEQKCLCDQIELKQKETLTCTNLFYWDDNNAHNKDTVVRTLTRILLWKQIEIFNCKFPPSL